MCSGGIEMLRKMIMAQIVAQNVESLFTHYQV